jgi:predicted dehydrogenase
MTQLTRRDFLQGSLAAAATVTLAGTKSSGKVLGASDTIRVAVAGLNGRGSSHLNALAGMKGVQVVCLIDPDTRTFGSRIKQVEKRGGNKPRTVQDVRDVLDDKDIDVISIATPNHWHALMTIWACQAGKDVYVEKPCSHNVHEGRIAVEMARKHNRIVQHGTQSRSSPDWARLAALVRSGKLGKLLISRALCYKPRNSIGTRAVSPVPRELDFDIWLGPAGKRDFHANLVHYNWHWFWDFGNGDIGNQGVHQMDIARWMIPDATLPQSVISLGGRFGYRDQGETPNTQLAFMDFGQTKLIFEVRGLKTAALKGQKIGNILHFEEGTVAGSEFYPKGSDKAQPLPRIEDQPRRPGGNIFANFIAAVRSRKRTDLDADILEGHYSSALGHLANISYRLGEEVSFHSRSRALGENKEVAETLARMQEHLGKDNKIDLEGSKYRLGRKLTIDKATEKVDDPEATKLLTRPVRKPFAVPEKV